MGFVALCSAPLVHALETWCVYVCMCVRARFFSIYTYVCRACVMYNFLKYVCYFEVNKCYI